MAFDPVITPCPLRAQGLTFDALPDGWCAHCDRTVVDLGALTERQARRAMARRTHPCVAVPRDGAGRPVYRRSRWLAVLAVLGVALSDARGAELDVEHGVVREPPPERAVDFGLGATANIRPTCHPGRFPHGPGGTAWITVRAGATRLWRSVTLTCREGRRTVLRERQSFGEPDGTVRFSEVPNSMSCEITARGAEPPMRVPVRTEPR